MRPIIYLAHPVAGDVEGNLAKAKVWLKWLQCNFPDAIFIAPWIVECQIYDDSDPAQREASLQRICAVVERCDAIVLVGARVSDGMLRESTHSPRTFDCTHPGDAPPEVPSGIWSELSAWIRNLIDDAYKMPDNHANLVHANRTISLIGKLCADHFADRR